MAQIFSIENLLTLVMLIALQAVLGFDNLLYISIESKRVAAHHQARVRQIGIGLAIVLRIVLLFVVMRMIEVFKEPFFGLHLGRLAEGEFTVHAAIVLAGGGFIIYTAVKEIFHMLAVEGIDHGGEAKHRSPLTAILLIVAMNLVFSFDSILSAMALTDIFWVMAVAIIVSGVLMIVMANQVSEFLKKNRMYEVLGLFVLLIVGMLLVSEGAHLAHLHIAGYPIEPMAKSTFYFVLGILVIVEIVQSRYRGKLQRQRAREVAGTAPAA